MDYVFEITDKSGKKVHSSKERWTHIRKKHPEVEDFESVKETIQNPDKIKDYVFDETIHHYYKYFKNRKSSTKYLFVSVKYLNFGNFLKEILEKINLELPIEISI